MGSKVDPFWGVPSRILNINHKEELLWSPWVALAPVSYRLLELLRNLMEPSSFKLIEHLYMKPSRLLDNPKP